MRHVEIHSYIPDECATNVFDTLVDFKKYEELVEVIHSVDIEKVEEMLTSSWVVEFRNGLLQWTEEDWFRRETLSIDFNQTEGDFDEFYGGWKIEATDSGVRAALIVDFDFGVPSLETIVEPVAERVLTDVTQQILLGLFGSKVEFYTPDIESVDGRPASNTAPRAEAVLA